MSNLQEADSIPEEEQAGELGQVAGEDSPNPEPSNNSEPEDLNDIISAVQKDVKGKSELQEDKGTGTDDNRDSEQAQLGSEGKDAKPESGDKDADKQSDVEAPQDWPQDRKDALAALPTPEAKRALVDAYKEMQSGFTRKSQEQAETVRFAESVRSLIDDPTRTRIAAEGRDELGYMRQLVGLEQFARSNPVEYIKTAMQTLGVSPEHLGIAPPQTQAAADEDDPLVDPDVAQLRQQVDGLSGSVQQQVQQAIQQYQQQTEIQNFQGVVQRFGSETDEEGNLIRPHFEKVRAAMSSLYNLPAYRDIADPMERLQKAYDGAVRADDELGPQTLKDEADKAAKEAADAERKKMEVDKAKKAKSPVSSSSAPASQSHKLESLDDIISDVTKAATAARV